MGIAGSPIGFMAGEGGVLFASADPAGPATVQATDPVADLVALEALARDLGRPQIVAGGGSDTFCRADRGAEHRLLLTGPDEGSRPTFRIRRIDPPERPSWVETHEQLPRLFAAQSTDPDALLRRAITTSLAEAVRSNGQTFPADGLDAATVSLRVLPNVREITGRDLYLPVVSFPDEDSYVSFFIAIGEETLVQGMSISAPFGPMIRAVGGRMSPDRHLPILVYCERPLSGMMPPDQILFHEATHGVDPNITPVLNDPEMLLMFEMAAVIGEFAVPATDRDTLNVWEGFFSQYALRAIQVMAQRGQIPCFSTPLQRILQLPPSLMALRSRDDLIRLIGQVDERMRALVRNLTMHHGNIELVRLIFSCRNFAELETRLRSLPTGGSSGGARSGDGPLVELL